MKFDFAPNTFIVAIVFAAVAWFLDGSLAQIAAWLFVGFGSFVLLTLLETIIDKLGSIQEALGNADNGNS